MGGITLRPGPTAQNLAEKWSIFEPQEEGFGFWVWGFRFQGLGFTTLGRPPPPVVTIRGIMILI